MNIPARKHFEKTASMYGRFRSQGLLGWLAEKERKEIEARLPRLKGKTVVDLGCGSGGYTKIAQEHGAQVVSVDFSPAMVVETKKIEQKVVVGAIETITFKKKFDVVLCCGPLEFVQDQGKAIKNISTMLNANGVLLIIYPRWSLGGLVYLLYHRIMNGVRIRIMRPSRFDAIVRNYGLSINEWKNITLISCLVECEKA